MRAIVHTLLMLSVSTTAGAHPLPGEASLPAQLWHQLLATHHAPLNVLLIVGGIVLARGLRGHLQEKHRR